MAPGGWRDDDYAAAWSALLRLQATLVPVLDEEVHDAAGIPLRWYDVLLELSVAPGRRMRMSDLGDKVVLSRTRVSRVVDELVSGGLVARIPNPDDGRSAFAAMTDEGAKVFRRAATVYLDRVRSHLRTRIPAAEIGQLRAVLERAADPRPADELDDVPLR